MAKQQRPAAARRFARAMPLCPGAPTVPRVQDAMTPQA
jgi:hypothetical protein